MVGVVLLCVSSNERSNKETIRLPKDGNIAHRYVFRFLLYIPSRACFANTTKRATQATNHKIPNICTYGINNKSTQSNKRARNVVRHQIACFK